MNLHLFKNKENLYDATLDLFKNQLKMAISAIPNKKYSTQQYFGDIDHELFTEIEGIYPVALINEASFTNEITYSDLEEDKIDYDTIFVVAVELIKSLNRSSLVQLTRKLNQKFNKNEKGNPLIVVFRYEDKITISSLERESRSKKDWREGEKIANTKVSMLKDIDIEKPHAAHLKILFGSADKKTTGLQIDTKKINSFEKLYQYWQKQLSIQALNDEFYADLQAWFYFAIKNIKIPYYVNEKEDVKNFLVRLLARTMFCWFVKEKGLIRNELLELKDWDGAIYPLTNDFDNVDFLQTNSYYRGILQNLFFNALNQKEKKSFKDFQWTKYWHQDLPINWFIEAPYLNGGIFDELEEDNAKESIEDSVIAIPNFLFYGIEIDTQVTKGKGAKATTTIQKVEQKGLNGILKSYKFTLDENTPFEEDIALDPEMLGLVFENLLAELDPNLEDSTIKSIRKLTGSFYTPRKTIFEMVNDSLFLYLKKYLQKFHPKIPDSKKQTNQLVYYDIVQENSSAFCFAIVEALDKFKMLDPACGSGAFPMGMLHRMVSILKLVDPQNEIWVELKLKNVDKAQQVEFKKVLTSHLDDYSRKLGIIRDSIYGIDIQPMAVQITKLRFFISLLIDQKTDKGITPMPNMETKIICANSLKDAKADLFTSPDIIEKLIEARRKYYQPDITSSEKELYIQEIVGILNDAFPSFYQEVIGDYKNISNVELIRKWFKNGTITAPFFSMSFFYPELRETGGFDCVIGNPPYGGTKISDEIRDALDIESKDPYGAFIARFLQRNSDENPRNTPLKNGGILAYIVSDTFMTIKSHLKLRKHLMQNYVHKMLRVHPDTFRATVNTVIMLAERNTARELDDNHICLMADLTNISIHDNYEHFVAVLNQTKGVDFERTDAIHCVSNEEYAIYYYPQALIKTNSNLPFFVASPKLFALMNDSGKDIKKDLKEIGGKQVQVRKIPMNGKEIEVVKLGDIADVKQGLATGDNQAYLYQKPDARGTYRSINDFAAFLLTEEDLDKIRNNDNLRLEVIDKGISKDNPKSERYFGGRYIIPYDKGGESDADGGWMPNYFVPTNYFIDWSDQCILKMKTYTIAQRIIDNNESKTILEHYKSQVAGVFRNTDTYFKGSIGFSDTGVYAPTFRYNSSSVYDVMSMSIFPETNIEGVLALLPSKLIRFFIKHYINHSIHTQVEGVKPIPIPSILSNTIKEIVSLIIQSQKTNSRYDYASHEQIEIDKLVYEAYGLNTDDVLEVENWYARRYPKLSAAQKANLRALGKSDDYLELYGLK